MVRKVNQQERALSTEAAARLWLSLIPMVRRAGEV